ncbi:MAG: PIN domain-containing protein [Thermoleophilia bacterium]|nr:PIN domain-containing protein [Thermoleophilia bacterium]
MTRLFVDTGGWIALLKRDDHMHARAGPYYATQVAEGRRFLTTSYVICETATRLRYDAGVEAAVAFRRAIERAVAGRSLRVAWIDARLEREGWDVLERYADIPLSLTDATSAAVARRAGVGEVFGFDRHFRALGFDVQPA